MKALISNTWSMTGKFNRKCNGTVSRIAFWQAMTAQLADFELLVHHREHLTPDDVKALKQIHIALFDCYRAAKGRAEFHKEALCTIRKEISHAS